ncbi:SOS mutagenesis and repair protein UmuC [Vreelandella aquamarina]|uniref:DNA polymerase V n=1 Tax=Vreelandella aquamarina TaxID=77097 RepID=A0A1N6CUZ1_9GAMM|nr:Y-family DNA polymerase [Halomonas meridiana]GED47401.1 SOS mutagenesis and repair protein UmuC [Halomonas meridiana]SIN62323.1 DNA polymerase V [Halomonas meridiana]SIN72268.1 DNA polymerase V [Halomonas meridiana]SIO21330.1 DNA polymerase V [Halomonas meridiana]
MIALVDCNNFYVSCERVFNPKLEGRPVGALSNNDGCVVARSQEIKQLGVAMGAPAHQIEPHIRRQCILLSSNYALYGDMSRRVTDVLSQHTPHVDVYSIDESFLSFEGFPPDTLIDRCQAMRYQVRRDTGIPVSVGLSTSKTLAKIANHRAKKEPGFDGVMMMEPGSDDTRAFLQQLPVTEIWGVAGRSAARLRTLGIETAWQLREASPKHLRKHFNVVMERIIYELRGEDCIPLDDMTQPKKQIMVSRSFGRLTQNKTDLREAIRTHASRAGEKLRKQQGLAQAIMVFVRTNRFRQDLPSYSKSIIIPLPYATCDSRDLVSAAMAGLEQIFKSGIWYQKCGVMLMDLCDHHNEQLGLLGEQQSADKRERNERLMATLDKLNREHGKNTVRLGMHRKANAWELRCENRTPRYTTRWDELATANT